jgi:hypothetical protein
MIETEGSIKLESTVYDYVQMGHNFIPDPAYSFDVWCPQEFADVDIEDNDWFNGVQRAAQDEHDDEEDDDEA